LFSCVAAEANYLNHKLINATSYAICTLSIPLLFYTVYPLYNFAIRITNNNFNILTMYVVLQ